MRELNISGNDSGQRLDKFLTKALPNLPQSLLYKYLRTKRIKVNGKRSEISYRLAEGDILSLYINDEFFGGPQDPLAFLLAKDGLDIVYEDANILLLNKPSGLVVHEDNDGGADTLIGRAAKYLYLSGQYDPLKENSFAPALCHRLDRHTSGLVLCAKNAPTLRVLGEKIREREITKLYRCLVLGVPNPPHAVATAYLLKDEEKQRVEVYDHPIPGGRTAVTEYTLLDSKDGVSLLEINLHTGRTHQIRAQMAHLGYPLAGDLKYGTATRNRELAYRHQALCAYSLTLDFPTDAGHLDYLKGKRFQVKDLPFSL